MAGIVPTGPKNQGANSRLLRLQFGPCVPRGGAYIDSVKLELKPFDFAQAAARAGLRPDGQPLAAPKAAAVSGGESFKVSMSKALEAVSHQQNESTRLQREVQLDNPEVSLEETMVAMQKSQIGFQAAISVRNRLVQAYTEIMNMQV
jgi:flagellar hook-basal body complex protein FliE